MKERDLKTVWVLALALPGQRDHTEPQYAYYGIRKLSRRQPKEEAGLYLDPNDAMHFETKAEANRLLLTLDGPPRFTVVEHVIVGKKRP